MNRIDTTNLKTAIKKAFPRADIVMYRGLFYHEKLEVQIPVSFAKRRDHAKFAKALPRKVGLVGKKLQLQYAAPGIKRLRQGDGADAWAFIVCAKYTLRHDSKVNYDYTTLAE